MLFTRLPPRAPIQQEEFKPLTKWWKEALGAGAVESVKVSRRLSATPCVVVASKVGGFRVAKGTGWHRQQRVLGVTGDKGETARAPAAVSPGLTGDEGQALPCLCDQLPQRMRGRCCPPVATSSCTTYSSHARKPLSCDTLQYGWSATMERIARTQTLGDNERAK